MKHLLTFIALLLLYTNLTFGECKILNNTDAKSTSLFERVFALVSKDLGIDTSNLEIYFSGGRFNQYYNELAALTTVNDSTYIIDICSRVVFKEDLIKTFMHELVHISQIYHKRLITGRTFAWFEGTVYGNDIPYEKRLYEKEAIDKTYELYKKYKKEIN